MQKILIATHNFGKYKELMEVLEDLPFKFVSLNDERIEDDVEEKFSQTLETFGRVDSCFANAGVTGRLLGGSFAEMPTEEWRRVMNINLDGAFFTLRAAVRHMISRKKRTVSGGVGKIFSLIRGVGRVKAATNADVHGVRPAWYQEPMEKFPSARQPARRGCVVAGERTLFLSPFREV